MKLEDYYKTAERSFYDDIEVYGSDMFNRHIYFPDYLETLSAFELIKFLMEASGESIYED